MNNVLNTLTSIRTDNDKLANEKIDSAILLRALTLSMDAKLLYKLGKKQKIARNKGTNKIAWRRYKPLPVATNRHIITEGVNPNGMKVGSMSVTGTVSVYGAYIQVTRQTEAYNLDKLLVEYGPLIVDHARETFELIVRDSIEEDGGHYYVVPKATQAPKDDEVTATDILTLDVCRTVANQMKVSRRKGHSDSNRYTFVISTEAMSDLLDDEKLEKKAMVPGNTNKPILDNSLEAYDIYNLRFYEYEYPVIKKNAKNVEVYHSYAFGENAYAVLDLESAGIEMKRFGFEPKIGDNLGQIASLGWISMGFGAAVLDPVACTIISHAVSNPLPRTDSDIYASQE